MQISSNAKIEFLFKLGNKFFSQKSLIIFIGKKSTEILVLNGQKIIANINISDSEQSNFEEYQIFLNLYRRYRVIFFVDSLDTLLRHEMIPVMDALIKVDQVEKFVGENYQAEDLVSCRIYDKKYENGEIWEVAIASCKYVAPLNMLLEYVISNSFDFGGIYFISLEIAKVIDDLVKLKQCQEYSDQMQIFTVITKSSDILITIKHKDNVMEQISIEYPKDKSDEYILGTVEQAISDKLLLYKNYIKHLDLKVILLFLCDNLMANLYSSLKFADHKIVTITSNDLGDNIVRTEQRFQDHNLINLVNKQKNYLALNKPLRSITKLSLFNMIAFKPLILILITLVIIISNAKYKSLITLSHAKELNEQYYKLSGEYRDLQKLYPEYDKRDDLADLYGLKSRITNSIISPFWALKYIFGTENDNIIISKVSWNTRNQDQILSDISTKNIVFDLKIDAQILGRLDQGKSEASVLTNELVENYLNHLKFVFKDYQVIYKIRQENTIILQSKIIVPISVTISGKIGGN